MPAKLSEVDAQKLKFEDIGTRKDSQDRAAETTLLKQVQAAGGTDKKAYNPTSANLQAALGTP